MWKVSTFRITFQTFPDSPHYNTLEKSSIKRNLNSIITEATLIITVTLEKLSKN